MKRLFGLILTTLALAGPIPGSVAATPLSEEPAPAEAEAAHFLGQTYMFLRIHSDSLLVRLEIASRDVERALRFGWTPERVPTRAEVGVVLDSIRSYIEPKVRLSIDGTPLTLRFRDYDARYVEVTDFVLLEYDVEDYPGMPEALDIHYSPIFEIDGNQRNLVVVEHNWRTTTFNNEANASLFLSPRDPDDTLDLSSASFVRGFVGIATEGARRVGTGIHYLLFLFALVLPAVYRRSEGERHPESSIGSAYAKVAKVIVFFTGAHAVALALGALGVVSLSETAVDILVSLSIAVVALSGLMPKVDFKVPIVATAFGLFSGVGMSAFAADIGQGGEYFVLSLLAFNVGAALGLLVIAAVALLIPFVMRNTSVYPRLLAAGSTLALLMALLLFFERVLGFNVPIGPLVRGVIEWFGSLVGAG